jgi:multiple sugar transport system substrate-binding protein
MVIAVAACGNGGADQAGGESSEEPATSDSSGADTDAATDETAGSDEKITLKVSMWEPYDENKSHVIATKKYTELTGVEFEWICVTDGYDEKMVTMKAGGNAPDLIQFWDTPKYVESGLVKDITPLIERDSFNPEGKYGIVEGFETYKGNYYGMSMEVSPRMIYYNKDIFDKYDVPYPEAGWTWDEFKDTVKKLTQGEGDDQTYGYIALADHTYLLQEHVWTNGGDFIAEDGSTATGYMDSAETKEAIQWYKDVFELSTQLIQGDTAKNLGEAEFMSGQIAMMDNGIWPVFSMEEAGINFGVVTPPVPREGAVFSPIIHSGAFGINPDTPYEEECWKFMKWVQSDEGQQAYAVTSLPILYQVSEETGQTQDEHKAPFIEVLQSPNYKIPCFVRNKNYAEAEALLAQAMGEIMLNDADVSDTLDLTAKDCDAILAQ